MHISHAVHPFCTYISVCICKGTDSLAADSMQGKVKAALRMLSQDSNDAGSGGPLPLTKDILDILRQKHPSKSTPVPSTLVIDEPPTSPNHF